MQTVSIVVPVYNEQENIEVFFSEVCRYLEPLAYDFEVIFVDDGSSDATPAIIDRLVQQDSRVRGLILAHNFGHQVALTCGLDYADGDAVITMDGDLQHPPAMLPQLIEKWQAGYDVVQTIRLSTEGVSLFKKLTSALYYKLVNMISEVPISEGGSDFRLMAHNVVLSFRKFRERGRFIRGMIGAIGYNQIQVDFVAPKRYAGHSKFSLKKMINFALDGITSYSRLPLRFAFYIGMFFAFVSFCLAAHVVYIKCFTSEAVPGWATISASISLLSGLQLLGMGIVGEYVGKIFEEVKQRPLYLVKNDLQNITKEV